MDSHRHHPKKMNYSYMMNLCLKNPNQKNPFPENIGKHSFIVDVIFFILNFRTRHDTWGTAF